MQSRILKALPHVDHDFGPQAKPLPDGALRLNQVHSATVVDTSGAGTPADGIYSDKAGSVIGVQTADCLPLLFAHRSKPLVAATHAGWRGLRDGIVIETVEKLAEQGCRASDLFVAIGPAIGPCCFEVDAQTFKAFEKEGTEFLFRAQPATIRGRAELQAKATSNHLWIDLAGIARAQLIRSGIPATQVELMPVCTYCGGENLASYRREFHRGAKANRQWSWISIVSETRSQSG